MDERIEALERAFKNLKLTKLKYKDNNFEIEFEKENDLKIDDKKGINLEEEILKLNIEEELKKAGLKRGLESLEREKELKKNKIEHKDLEKSPEVLKKVEEDIKENKSLKGNLVEVKCPVVGIFYSKESPEKEPFVSIGQSVKKDETICIIEAMKMFTEIKSPVDGIVKSINYSDEDLVEAEKVIFEIEE